MAAVDLFCAPDDQHRVVLLVDLLKQAGRSVVLRPEPVGAPSNPCIVAWTARAVREPWLASLFETAPTLVALRLDDTPLPGSCARTIGMQNWPARSADRQVGALVDWLLRHGPPLEVAGLAAPEVARAVRGAPTAGAAVAVRRRPRDRRSAETRRNFLVLAFLVVGGVLMWWAAAERDDGSSSEAEAMLPDPAVTARPERMDGELPDPDGWVAVDAQTDGSPPLTAGGEVPAQAGAGASAAPASFPSPGSPLEPPAPEVARSQVMTQATAGEAPPAAQPVRPPPVQDALAHLCQARTPAAAQAWAGVLDWKQRRRLPEESCVAQLLARPGFAGLAPLLGRATVRPAGCVDCS